MHLLRATFCGLFLFLLAACAAPSTETGRDGQPTAVTPSSPDPIVDAVPLLDGAVVTEDPMSIQYAVGILYREGAVLPTREGLDRLQALGDWLAQRTQMEWTVHVGSVAGGDGPSAEAIATGREKLLKQLFRRKGLAVDDWLWDAGESLDYQLKLQPSTVP